MRVQRLLRRLRWPRPPASAGRAAAARIALLALLVAPGLTAAASGEGERAIVAGEPFVLEEHLGVAWERELLSYPFESDAPEPGGGQACHPDGLSLRGPRGPLAVQLTRDGRVAFIADLAPGASDRYQVDCQAMPRTTAGPASDLSVEPVADGVALRTSLFGARMPLGSVRYPSPVHPSRVPAPVAAFLDRGSQEFGGSRLFGPGQIRAWSAELVEAGPVLAAVAIRYEYADGTVLSVRAELAAGDSTLAFDTRVEGSKPKAGFELLLSRGLPPLVFRVAIEGGTRRKDPSGAPARAGEWLDLPVADLPPGTITRLTPWADWWDDTTQTAIRLQIPGSERELRITRRNAGHWVAPAPPGTLGKGGPNEFNRIPLTRDRSGALQLRVDAADGRRSFSVGMLPRRDDRAAVYRARFLVDRAGDVGRRLDVVKRWALDWPQTRPNPNLFLDASELAAARERKWDPAQIETFTQSLASTRVGEGTYVQTIGLGAYLMTGDPSVAKRGRLVERLRHDLALLGDFDMMRKTSPLVALYDAMMASDLISPADRKRFRAQFAYLGYRLTEPDIWSYERGYTSGNANMSVAFVLASGIVAAAIPDHPQARAWAERGIRLVDRLLDENVGPAGEWPESVAHYAHVASSPLTSFTIAMKNAGFADFTVDPRMQRLMLYLAKHFTPPDPRHTEADRGGTSGVSVPIGRGAAGESSGVQGAFARAAADTAPELSRNLQWVWLRNGSPRRLPVDHLGGWEHVYLDPELPAEQPDWEMDSFPKNGVLMRHGIGSPHEWWVYLVNEQGHTIPAESGTLPAVFARGVPISSRMVGSYPDREELLLSRVLLARGRGTPAERSARFSHEAETRRILSVAGLPRQQYAAGEYTIDEPWSKQMAPPKPNSYSHMRELPEWPAVAREGQPGVHWKRQLQFVRSADPDGTSYLVLRDSVSGGEPTMWQFWTVSEKIGAPGEAADRRRFLADAPGARTAPARRLPRGNRYTALGSFGVDVEFYIAEPLGTPRHTLRFGLTHAYESVAGYTEYQDLLHLQREDDGAYFVAIVPRDQHGEAPAFETLGDGTVIRVSGSFGKDLCFLSGTDRSASADGARFRGSAASVQDRAEGLVLSLPAPGAVAYGGFELESAHAAELHVEDDAALVLHFPDPADPTEPSGASTMPAEATLRAPGKWRLDTPSEGARLERASDGALLVRPAPGLLRVRLVRP